MIPAIFVKKKSAHRSHIKHHKSGVKLPKYSIISIHYVFIVTVILLVAAVGLFYNNWRNTGNVLGASIYLADNGGSDGGDKTNSTDNSNSTDSLSSQSEKPQVVEPTDVPEIKQQVEQVQQEIQNKIEKSQLQSIEVQPTSDGSSSGRVILQQNDKSTQQIGLTASQTASLTQISTPQAGTLSVQVNAANSVTITNGPYTITTQYPVVVDPTSQTMAIRTPSGVTVIKTFPVQALQSLPTQNKLSSVSSINLTDQQGTPVYQTSGVQIRKFLGLIPVSGNVSEQINAQTGQATITSLPWYFSVLNFAFQSPQST